MVGEVPARHEGVDGLCAVIAEIFHVGRTFGFSFSTFKDEIFHCSEGGEVFGDGVDAVEHYAFLAGVGGDGDGCGIAV